MRKEEYEKTIDRFVSEVIRVIAEFRFNMRELEKKYTSEDKGENK